MSALTFRNRLGNLIDIPAIAASEVKNKFGAILDRAAQGGAVAITRHDTTKAVLISIEEFQSLTAGRDSSLMALGAEFDGLLAQMQTSAHRKGIEKAFAAAPGQLGKTAVKAAAAHGKKR